MARRRGGGGWRADDIFQAQPSAEQHPSKRERSYYRPHSRARCCEIHRGSSTLETRKGFGGKVGSWETFRKQGGRGNGKGTDVYARGADLVPLCCYFARKKVKQAQLGPVDGSCRQGSPCAVSAALFSLAPVHYSVQRGLVASTPTPMAFGSTAWRSLPLNGGGTASRHATKYRVLVPRHLASGPCNMRASRTAWETKASKQRAELRNFGLRLALPAFIPFPV